MKKRTLSLLLAIIMLLGMAPIPVAEAASTLEEAMADVRVYARPQKLNWLTMNGTIRNQEYTYYLYQSVQTGETKEIPAYCVDPRLYGVPYIMDHNDSVDYIRYSAESTITDYKLCGIITSGYPHCALSDLGLQSVDEAYYATKTAVWIYLLGDWNLSGLGINPNLTGEDKAAAQRVLQATKLIYQNGMMWDEMYSPQLTATPDRSTAYAATINGEECYQQVFTIDSNTWPQEAIQLSLEEGAPAGTKITDMDNAEISQVFLSRERTPGAGFQAKVKVVYPKSVVEGESGTCQLIMNANVVEYKLYYAHTLEADKYGKLQNYILDTDPDTPITASAISSYSSEPTPPPPDPEESTLKIIKLEEGTEIPLAGATFRVLYPNGQVYGSFTTDETGMITLPINVFGNYSVQEIVPPRYHLLPEHTTQDVVVTALDGGVLTFHDAPFGNLRVHKISSAGDNLNGVTISIRNLETGETRTAQTAAGGIAEFTQLKPGGYEVRETAGIDGYVADVEAAKTATVVTGETSELTFVNKEKPGLKIVKYDRTTLQTMADVSFRVWKDGELLGDYPTDALGEILLPNLEPGTYVVQEIAGPTSHIVDPTPQQVELHAGDGMRQLLFYNDQKPGIHLIKVDSENLSKVIPNVKFRIAAVDGSWGPREYTTDVHGEIDLSELPTGAYTVTEVAVPDGYLIDNAERIIELTANSTAEFVFTNTKKPVIEVVKYDSNTGRYLAGATFRIAKIEDASHYLDRVTGTDGRIRIEDLEPGIYSVQELTAPSGYVLNDTEYHVELFPGRTSEIVVENQKKPDLKIIKTDANTGLPVAGATFTVRKIDSSTLTTETTDRNGEILLTGMDPGVYEITEQSVPDGFLLDPIPQKITLEPNKLGVVQFQDFPKPTLLIKKIDSVTGKPVAGARFHVTYGSNHTFTGEINDIGEYFSDENGEILLENLTDGWYKVQEMEAPAGYRIKDDGIQECYIAAGHGKVLTFENIPLSTILIQKMDEETGKPLAGAAFRVKYLNNMTSIDGTTLGDYVTDADGSIELTNLDEGTYVIDEISAPAGYVLNAANTRTVYLSGENQDFISLIYGNQHMGSLLIVKKDALTGEPLSGVEFFVCDSDGSVVGNANGKYTTDYAGSILIPNLEPGKTIVAKETRTVSGYILDDTPQTVKIKANETVTLEFRDQPKGTLIVQKVDEATGEPLTGAEFRITMSNGELTADNEGLTSSNGLYEVDRNGQIVLEKLNPGTYVVTEIKAPDGYILSAEPVTVAVGPADTQTITVGNPPKGNLVIHKMDTLTHEPLSGVEFSIKYADGTVVDDGNLSSNGRYVTDRNGQIILSGITGTLVITEEKTVAGYVINQANRSQTVVVNANDTQNLYFYNTPRGALMIRKVDSATGEPLAGAEFTVVPVNNEQTDTGLTGTAFTTDRSGQIVLEQLLPVSYLITETKAPDNYVLDALPQTATVAAGDTRIVTFADSHKGSLTIHKLDALTHEPLEGVQFKLAYADGTVVDNGGLSSNGLYTTDRNGQIVVSNITGTIVATEVATISGYVIDPESRSQTVEVRTNDAQHITFYNAPKGSLVLQKYDRVTNQPLADAVFSITTANGEPVASNEGLTSSNGLYRTDEEGMIVLTNLTPQTYIVTEVEAPKGYALDAQTKTVVVSSSDTQFLRFYDEPLAVLTLLKRDAVSKLPLANAEFTVRTADGTAIGTDNGRYITDDTGTATITGIEPDTAVVVSEDSAPAGYVANATPKTIMVRSGVINSLTFDDEPTTTLIIKKCIEGTNYEPLAGVGFRVTDSTGAAVGPDNGTYYTDRAGEIMITGLAPGISVVAQEFKTVDGFILDGTPQTVKIENYQRMELLFWNARKGSLTVRKLDSVTREPLAGVEFQINYANGTPVDADNGSTSSNGRYFTDRNGEITIDGVHGTVVVTETATIPGYTIDEGQRSQTVVVNADDHQTLIFTNTPKQALTIQKLEAGTDEPLEGVKFLVTDSDGTVLGPENGVYTTDRYGRIVLEDLTPGTTIIAKEVETISGYVLNPAPQSIQIRSGEAQTLTFVNQKKGSLIIEKRDSISGELLSGAVFKVTTLDGTPVNDDEGRNVTRGIYSTDRNGQIVLTKLQPDTYVVQEIEALEGYVLNSEKQTVRVNAEEAQTISFDNVPLQNVTIQKYAEGTTTPLAGVRFLVTDASGNPVGGSNGEYQTDANGRIVISGIAPGTALVVRETKTVDGYQLNSAPQTIEVTALNAGTRMTRSGNTTGATGSNQLTFYDDPLATLVLHKYITGTANEPLAGVAFRVTDGTGADVGADGGVYYTDERGEIVLTDLEPGMTVIAQEIHTVDGFVLDGVPQRVTLQSGVVSNLTFWNKRQGALTIHKLDSATQAPLEGVTFKITTATGEFVPDESGHISSNGLYKTDRAGEIILRGITGTLVVTEVETIPGYSIHEATRSQTVVVNPEDNQQLTFYNDPLQTLTIKKYVAGTTEPIEGVRFKVTSSDGAVIGSSNGEFVTDRSGQIVISGLVPGTTVTAQEIETVSGFVLNSTPQSLLVKSGEAMTMTFFNEKKGSLTIEKRDSVTGEALAGAEFKITNSAGVPVDDNEGTTSTQGIFTTDEHGQIILTKLTPDTYIVRETKAPAGYVLDAEQQAIRVNANDAQTVTFTNTPLQSFTLQKYIDGTTTPLPGVTFYITDASGAPVGEGSYVTDENGQIVLTGLVPGTTLIVRETKTVRGYELNSEPRTIQVGVAGATRSASLLRSGSTTASTGTNQITIYDSPLSTLVSKKYIKGTDREPLEGVAFKVTDGNGGAVGNNDGVNYTDASGEIVIPGLETGAVITVREIATVDGYILDGTPKQVEIKNYDVHELVFWNAKRGALTIRVLDSVTQHPLENVTVKVTTTTGEFVPDQDGHISSNGLYKTDAAGEIVLNGVTGSFVVSVAEPIPGYSIHEATRSQTISVNPDDTQQLTAYCDPLQTLTVQVYEKGTTTPLAGIPFKVTASDGKVVGEANGEYVSDRNGQFSISGLTPGVTITAREVGSISGYVLNSDPQSILIKDGDAQRLVFFNSPKGSLIVKLKDAATGDPIADAEFKFTTISGAFVPDHEGRTSTNGSYRTDENGEIRLLNLLPDTYVVEQVSTDAGHVMDSRTQTVKVDAADAQSLEFTNTALQNAVIQKYAEGGTEPLEGVTFYITDGNGNPISGNGMYVTNAAGQIVLTGLKPGTTVVAREVKTVRGYQLNSEPQMLVVGAVNGGANTADGGAANQLTFYDSLLSTLVIKTFIADTDDEPLSGIVYKVTDGNGGAIGPNDGTYTSNDAGEITIPDLPTGTVVNVRQIRTADGFILNGTPKQVTIKSSNVHEIVFRAEKQGALIIRAFDSATKAALPGVAFSVAYADGQPVSDANGHIGSNGSYTTDENGEIRITGVTGSILVTAQGAPAGYAIDPDSRVKNATVNPDATLTLDFSCNPLQTLTVQVYEKDTTTPLAGIPFKVTSSDGKVVGEANGEYVSDRNGQFSISGLTTGVTITAREVGSISGYVLNSDPQSILIKSGDAQRLVFFNSPKGSLVVKLKDAATGDPIADAEFKITTISGAYVPDNEGTSSTNGSYRTEENGEIRLLNLLPDTYVVEQVSTDAGHVMDSRTQTVKVDPADAQSLEFTNTALQNAVIQKYAEGGTEPLAGVTFYITDGNGSPISGNGMYVTNAAGQIVLTGLKPGTTVIAREVKTVRGYQLNSEPQTLVVGAANGGGNTADGGATNRLTFYDSLLSTLVVRTFIAGTDDEPLSGIVYKVTDGNGGAVGHNDGTYTSDDSGEITIPDLATGTVVNVRQIQTADGFILNGTPKQVTIKSSDVHELVFRAEKQGALIIRAFDSATKAALPGVAFSVAYADGQPVSDANGHIGSNGSYTTDENGEIHITGVTGSILVTAQGAPAGYAVDPDSRVKNATVNPDATLTLDFSCNPLQTLTVQVYEKDTTTPLAGIPFKVTSSDGKVVGEANGEYVSDRNGQFSISGLTPGVTITAQEVGSISGYVLNADPQSILIKSGDAQRLVFFNSPKGSLVVKLKDAATGNPIADAEFKVTTISGAFVPDNEGRTSTNGSYKTDENGEIRLLNLLPDTYVIEQVSTDAGHVMDSRTQTVKVDAADAQSLEFTNTALQNAVIQKYAEGGTEPLAGVTFYITDGNGSPISGNGMYVTNAAGQIVLTGLKPGTTVVAREVKTVRGYQLNSEPQTLVVGAANGGGNTADGGAANRLTFYDSLLSTLIVRTFIAGTDDEPLSGIVYKVTDGNGGAVGPNDGTYTSDDAGEITIPDLATGTVVNVRQIQTADGFILNGTPKQVTIKSSDVHELVFRAEKQGALIIRAFDSATKAALPGVAFSVAYADGQPVSDANGHIGSNGSYTTNENGEIRITGVTGNILVTAQTAPAGYAVDPDSRSKNATVNPDSTLTLDFSCSPLQTLTVQVYEKGTTTPLAGIPFEVSASDGKVVGEANGEYVSDRNGQFSISGLTPGVSITAREVGSISGYVLNADPQSILIKDGDAQRLVFFNSPKGSLVVKLKDAATGDPIADAEFKVTTISGAFVPDNEGRTSTNGSYKTDENGEIRLLNLQPDTYVVEQVSTDAGHVMDSRTQTVKVDAADAQSLEFTNTTLQSVVIQKYVEGSTDPLPGVTFLITDGSGAPIGGGSGEFVTDANGRIVINGLKPGTTVIAKEIRTAKGYQRDGVPQTIVVGSGSANGATGPAASNQITFYDAPLRTLYIRKYVEGSTTPIKGVRFLVTANDGRPVGNANGEFTTDENGCITIPNLEPGTVITAKETKAAEGYVINTAPKSITIQSGDAQELCFYNSPAGSLTIIKKDRATEKPLKGATFEITYANGEFVDANGGKTSTNGAYTTDANGKIVIRGLQPSTIIIRETKAPDGYSLNDTPVTVEIKPNDAQTVTIYNDAKQTLTVQKFVTGTTTPIQGAKFLITDSSGATLGPNNGEYSTDRNGRIVLTGLEPGVTITAKEISAPSGFVLDSTPQSILIKQGKSQTMTFYNTRDGGVELIKVDAADKSKRIPGATFEIRKMDQGLVETVTTDRTGCVRADLAAGDYYAVEIEAAEGYQLDPTPTYFTITDGKRTTVTVTNKALCGIEIRKTDSVTGEGIYGVSFLLYDGKNNVVGQYTTDNRGYVRILDITEAGTYRIRELENPGYIVDTQLKTVEVKSGEITLVEWKNTPVSGQIQITKTSEDYNSMNGWPAGTPIPNTVFEVYNRAGNLVDTIQTDKNGVAATKPLPLGRYKVVESKAADFYGLDKTPIEVEIEFAGQIVRAAMTNKSLYTNVSITKRGYAEVMPGQTIRYDFSNIANNSSTALESFYWRDTIPVQSARLDKVVTGTWNVQGGYKIVYRTNLNEEYRTLADNLATGRNYVLAASPTALGLASNEYVTEVMFSFGVVPANFRQVEAPHIDCTVLQTVTGGSEFVNTADVGGVYNGQWIMAVDRWVTRVYAPAKPLPRTGY